MASKWDELLERNRVYSETKHQPKVFFGEGPVVVPSVFIFACLDFRASVEDFLDLKADDALIVRNLGGRVKSGLQSLVFLDEITGGQVLKEVIIIHHTNCGCSLHANEDIRAGLKSKYPQVADEIEQIDFGTYKGGDLENHERVVREDIKLLKASSLIREDLKSNVRGYVFDIKTGKLTAVSQ